MSVKRVAGRLRKNQRVCYCGTRFTPKRKNQKHCSPQCRGRAAMRAWRREQAKKLQRAQEVAQ